MAAPQIVTPIAESCGFPPISNDFGSSQWIEAKKTSYPILNKVSSQPLTRWKECAGSGLSSEQASGRFFRFLNQALLCEVRSEFRRADFFWRLVHRINSRLSSEESWPAEIKDHLSSGGSVSKEILINAHLAVLEASEQSKEKHRQSRIPVHLDYLLILTSNAALAKEEEEALLGPRLLKVVTEAISNKRWSEVERYGKEMTRRFPQRFAYFKIIAEGYTSRCVSALRKEDDERAARENAATLKDSITEIENLRQLAPHYRYLYDLLATLSRLRAIQLANAGLLSDAVLCNERASCYNPFDEEIVRLRQGLSTALKTLQEQMERTVANLGYRQKLTSKGESLLRQARIGFDPANSFNDSHEAKEIEFNRTIAHARWLWRWIGLGPVVPNTELLLVVSRAVNAVFQTAIENPSQLTGLWERQVELHPELANVNASTVLEFLGARVKGEEISERDEDPVPEQLTAFGRLQLEPSKKGRWSLEPFSFWLFAGESRLLKIATTVLLGCLAVLTVFAAREANHRSVRAKSYEAMQTAMLNQDYSEAMQQAAVFLETSVLAEDSRDQEVRLSYAEALVRWASMQPNPPSPDDIRLRNYRRLVKE